MDRTIIDQYEHGGEKLKQSIRGLTPEDLLAIPVPGSWSIQQVVLHLMDSDLIATDRMKRVIAEENPTLIGFDETRFVKNLFYEVQPADDAVTLFDLNRRMFSNVLRKLPDSAFERIGTHNERGQMKLSDLLGLFVWHLDHHLKFIYDKREKMGKLMW